MLLKPLCCFSSLLNFYYCFQNAHSKISQPCFLKLFSQNGARDLGIRCLDESNTNLANSLSGESECHTITCKCPELEA